MRIISLLCGLLFVCGCIGLDQDGYEHQDGRSLAQGYTPCNDAPGDDPEGVICSPNQYCGDQKLNWCFRGCLSEDNCSTEQICSKKPGQNVGQCLAWDDVAPVQRDLDPGYTACGDERIPVAFEICQPSQYCASYRDGRCYAGCLSEDNCTENQTCEKEVGSNAGVCR